MLYLGAHNIGNTLAIQDAAWMAPKSIDKSLTQEASQVALTDHFPEIHHSDQSEYHAS
jgi:hypothetical protein